jgi:uncharacterized coiled-coil DUF342 family protein
MSKQEPTEAPAPQPVAAPTLAELIEKAADLYSAINEYDKQIEGLTKERAEVRKALRAYENKITTINIAAKART